MLTSRCHPPPWHLEFIINRHHNEDAAVVRSTDLLDIITDFLGIQPAALEAALSYRTKLLKKELYTVFLNPDGAFCDRYRDGLIANGVTEGHD